MNAIDIAERHPPSGNPNITRPPADRTVIQVADLDFFYGRTQALFDAELPIERGKITALIGPSGCGKSTLLRVLNRIYSLYPGQRAQGRVTLDGEDILAPGVDVAALRARVGMVFQKPTPFPMSIYENITFGLKLAGGQSKSRLDQVVEESLRKAALWDEVKDKLKSSGLSLSGGQQQRLCVARGIAVKPEVLLLDEPASALDPISTAKLEQTLIDLKDELTIVIVTHNLQQAARVSDHTGFMFLGRMIEFGPTEEIFARPRVERTQEYITGRFG